MFLQDVAELELKFQDHLTTVGGMVEIGETVDRVDCLVRETHSFHKLAMVRATKLYKFELQVTSQKLLTGCRFASLYDIYLNFFFNVKIE